MLWIGDSHCTHLKDYVVEKHLPEYQKMFMSKTTFIAVGGTKWWEIRGNLNGLGLSAKKWAQYGDQSHEFEKNQPIQSLPGHRLWNN